MQLFNKFLRPLLFSDLALGSQNLSICTVVSDKTLLPLPWRQELY